MNHQSKKGLVALGVAGAFVLGAVLLWPKKSAAKGGGKVFSADWDPNGVAKVSLNVGDVLSINLPQGRAFNVETFTGMNKLVSFSIGNGVLQFTALAPGSATIVIDDINPATGDTRATMKLNPLTVS
jgi:hypothetical protein